MAARDSRRDCRIGSSLSLRERDLGGRVQSLLNPDAEVEDIPTLTPARSPRERGGYAGCFRLMPIPRAPLPVGEGQSPGYDSTSPFQTRSQKPVPSCALPNHVGRPTLPRYVSLVL